MMSISSIVVDRTCRMSLPGWVSELRMVKPGAKVIETGFGTGGAGGAEDLLHPSFSPTTIVTKPMTIRTPSAMTAAKARR